VGLWRGLNSSKPGFSVVMCFVVGWLNGCIGEMGGILGSWIVCVDGVWASDEVKAIIGDNYYFSSDLHTF